MILKPDETEQFYRIWFPLLKFVNAQRNFILDFPHEPDPDSLDPNDAMTIRNALWADDSLLEQFLAENPAGLPPEYLALAATWKYRVSGEFFVLKHLKRYSVFLGTEAPCRAYGVLGLRSPIADVLGPRLPILVDAVLLPFRERIIYDSLMASYNIFFGGGARRSLKISLRDVEEREGITTSLVPRAEPPSGVEARKAARTRNAKVLRGFGKALLKSGLSPKKAEECASAVAEFSDLYLLERDPPRPLLALEAEDVEAWLRSLPSSEATAAAKSFKRFARFLLETERSDMDTLSPLMRILKSYRPGA